MSCFIPSLAVSAITSYLDRDKTIIIVRLLSLKPHKAQHKSVSEETNPFSWKKSAIDRWMDSENFPSESVIFFFFFDSHEHWEVCQIRMLCVDIAFDNTAWYSCFTLHVCLSLNIGEFLFWSSLEYFFSPTSLPSRKVECWTHCTRHLSMKFPWRTIYMFL